MNSNTDTTECLEWTPSWSINYEYKLKINLEVVHYLQINQLHI
jgi:hypothetical protein